MQQSHERVYPHGIIYHMEFLENGNLKNARISGKRELQTST